MTNKNTFNSTTHYRNWTITLDYKSEKICWSNCTNEYGSWELIGSSIHDDKFINWKINKILQIIDEIIKKETQAKENETLSSVEIWQNIQKITN